MSIYKRGQMQISFGMIFSIILIIVFLAFAFFGIRTFLGIQKTGETAKFIEDFQSDIERVWKSSSTSEEKEYRFPSEKSFVCFVDFSSSSRGSRSEIYDELKRAYYGEENLVFYPLNFDGAESFKINYIDLDTITEAENPYCVPNIQGKVNLRLEKGLSDALVTITRA